MTEVISTSRMDKNKRTYSKEFTKKLKSSLDDVDVTLSSTSSGLSSQSVEDIDEIALPLYNSRIVIPIEVIDGETVDDPDTSKDEGIAQSYQLPDIDSKSLRSLEPGQELKDNIVEFYITYLINEKFPHVIRDKIHVFSTFFYKKLKKFQSLSDKDRKHLVTRWDKHVKLFDKKYLVLPICEFNHWMLVMACHANCMPPDDLVILEENNNQRKSSLVLKEPVMDMRSLLEGRFSFTKAKSSSPKAPTLPQQSVLRSSPRACLMIFDSMNSNFMTKFTAPFRSYLNARWTFEKPSEDTRDFKDRTIFREYSVNVPKQRNPYDCGVHLLHSFEKFFENPGNHYGKIRFNYDFRSEWRIDTREKREHISKLIRRKQRETKNVT